MSINNPGSAPERFRNPEDRHDNPSVEEVRREVLAARDRIVVDAHPANEAEREAVRAAEAFAAELSKDFRAEFMRIFEKERAEHPAMTEKMLAWLDAHRYTMPTLTILDPRTGDAAVERFGYYVSENADAVVIFQLPAPLARYWWKGSTEMGDPNRPEDLGAVTYQWGKIYQEVIATVWRKFDEARSSHGIAIRRINRPGRHSPKGYYYIWIVRKVET